MKKGWETKKLGEICKFQGGSQPPKAQFIHEPKKGYVRFLQIRDFTSDKNITFIPASNKNRLCSETDIMIGRYGASVGKILSGRSGAYNVALMKTIPNLSFLRPKWFHNYLISDVFQHRLMSVADRSAQNGFSQEDIFNFPVPLPKLDEQERIVAVLDKAFAELATAQANAEKNLQNARALFESHLSAIYSIGSVELKGVRDWQPLGKVCKTGSGGTPPKDKREYYDGGAIPWLMSGEVSQGEITRATKFITQAGLDNSAARIFPENTVLVAMYGATAGQVGILRIKSATNQAVCGIFPNDTFVPEFLFYLFLSKKADLVAQATGNAQPNISQVKIKNIEVPILPLDHQWRIVKHLDALFAETRRLARLYEQKQASLVVLKKSLLHYAFAGEL